MVKVDKLCYGGRNGAETPVPTTSLCPLPSGVDEGVVRLAAPNYPHCTSKVTVHPCILGRELWLRLFSRQGLLHILLLFITVLRLSNILWFGTVWGQVLDHVLLNILFSLICQTFLMNYLQHRYYI
jgi:hypothetical protein